MSPAGERPPSTIRTALEWARDRLAPLGDNDPALEAELLLAHLLGQGRSFLYAWPERVLDPGLREAYGGLVRRRAAGEPVAHLRGRQAFWSLELEVSGDTLIPRPETELLVETALDLLAETRPARVLDLGCGSGAIALALASERPAWELTAVERSPGALAVAERNRRALGLDRVRLLQGSWYAPLAAAERFDLILSNPPYVAAGDPHLQRGDLRFEPPEALEAGPRGLDALRIIARQAPVHLSQGGWLLLEHGATQGAEVRTLMQAAGLSRVASRRDLGGHERVTLGRLEAEKKP